MGGITLFFCMPPVVARKWSHGRAPLLSTNYVHADLSPLPQRRHSQQGIYTVPHRVISDCSDLHARHDRRFLSFPLLSSPSVIRHL